MAHEHGYSATRSREHILEELEAVKARLERLENPSESSAVGIIREMLEAHALWQQFGRTQEQVVRHWRSKLWAVAYPGTKECP
jgi:hypothetical protein